MAAAAVILSGGAAEGSDYYTKLDLPFGGEGVSSEAIRKAYYKCALKHHPDKHAHNSEADRLKARTRFRDVSEAFEVLRDECSREKYDLRDETVSSRDNDTRFNEFDVFNVFMKQTMGNNNVFPKNFFHSSDEDFDDESCIEEDYYYSDDSSAGEGQSVEQRRYEENRRRYEIKRAWRSQKANEQTESNGKTFTEMNDAEIDAFWDNEGPGNVSVTKDGGKGKRSAKSKRRKAALAKKKGRLRKELRKADAEIKNLISLDAPHSPAKRPHETDSSSQEPDREAIEPQRDVKEEAVVLTATANQVKGSQIEFCIDPIVLDQLVSMGFTDKDQNSIALVYGHNDLEAALEYLLSSSDETVFVNKRNKTLILRDSHGGCNLLKKHVNDKGVHKHQYHLLDTNSVDTPSSKEKEPFRDHQKSAPLPDMEGGIVPSNYRTQMCTNVLQKGFCRFGDACHFAHGGRFIRGYKGKRTDEGLARVRSGVYDERKMYSCEKIQEKVVRNTMEKSQNDSTFPVPPERSKKDAPVLPRTQSLPDSLQQKKGRQIYGRPSSVPPPGFLQLQARPLPLNPSKEMTFDPTISSSRARAGLESYDSPWSSKTSRNRMPDSCANDSLIYDEPITGSNFSFSKIGLGFEEANTTRAQGNLRTYPAFPSPFEYGVSDPSSSLFPPFSGDGFVRTHEEHVASRDLQWFSERKGMAGAIGENTVASLADYRLAYPVDKRGCPYERNIGELHLGGSLFSEGTFLASEMIDLELVGGRSGQPKLSKNNSTDDPFGESVCSSNRKPSNVALSPGSSGSQSRSHIQNGVLKDSFLGDLPPAFIFLCNHRTEMECLSLGVFANTRNSLKLTQDNVKPGTIIFLINFESKVIRGVFQPTRRPGLRIDPRASFNSRFPVQVRVKSVGIQKTAQLKGGTHRFGPISALCAQEYLEILDVEYASLRDHLIDRFIIDEDDSTAGIYSFGKSCIKSFSCNNEQALRSRCAHCAQSKNPRVRDVLSRNHATEDCRRKVKVGVTKR